MAKEVDLVLIVGSPNSSNSRRLVEVAQKNGCRSVLIQRASEINWDLFEDVKNVGISAGASAPEILVEEVMQAVKSRFKTNVENILTIEENVTFKVPAILSKDDD